MMKSWICHTFKLLESKAAQKIPINTDLSRVHRSGRPSHYHSTYKIANTYLKEGLQNYCEIIYPRSWFNPILILKNSKELLEHLKSPNFNLNTSIKPFNFSTLYTAIPHQKLKNRLATITQNSFIHKNGYQRYKNLVLGREGPNFVFKHSDLKTSTLKITLLTC